MIKKGYTDGPFGQIHWRVAGEATDWPDLFCLHPAPYSGLAFETIMPLLAKERRVIAQDYPGYGGSDAGPASIPAYADAVLSVIEDFSPRCPVDLMGFHTGCLVAAACCLNSAARVRKASLVDCPSFDPEKRPSLLSSVNAFRPSAELQCLEAQWRMGVTKRIESQSLERAFGMFVEMLRPGANMNDAFAAAYSYEWESVFPKIETTTLVLATQSVLLEPSRLGASHLGNARLVERLDIKRAVLDEAAAETAEEVLKFLDAE